MVFHSRAGSCWVDAMEELELGVMEKELNDLEVMSSVALLE